MDIKKLNSLYYKKKNIKALEEELAELNNLGSAPLNNLPRSNKISRPTENYVIKKMKIVEKLKKAYESYYEEYENMNNYINQIEDDKVKLIARLRFLHLKDWFYIAEEISPEDKSIHWTTPRKILMRYIESESKNENDK